MQFKSVSIVKHPITKTWQTMLASLPEIASQVEDIQSVVELEREDISEKITKVVCVWQANPKLPDIISKKFHDEMLSWTDTAFWDKSSYCIQWKIVSHYFKGMKNEGTTQFEPAMGGKGCKLNFSGSLHLDHDSISMGFGLLNAAVLKAAESIMAQMIPSNFRRMVEVLNRYMDNHQ